MADAIPPAPPTVTVSASGGGGPVALTVLSDAAAVVELLDGALVEGQAQARAAKGMVEVVTADGTLQLKAPPGVQLPPIPPGARLLLQMIGQGADGQVMLLAINGRPLGGATIPAAGSPAQPPLQPGAPAGLPGPANPLPAPQPGAPAVAIGAPPPADSPFGLTATVIRPAQLPGMPAPPGQTPPWPAGAGVPPDLPAGTRLTVRIAGIMPMAEGVPGAQPLPGPASPTGQPGPTAMPAAGLPPAPPGGIPPTAAPTPTLLPGMVTAHPPGGQAVVQTPAGVLAVPTHADLPPGTGLLLEVVGKPLPPLPAAAPTAAAPQGLSPQGWPALSEALDVLATANQPQALEQLLRALPQPDARLAASMAAFAGTLRSGEARALLPENTVRGIEKAGRKDLAARLRGDLEELGREAGQPVAGGDWRAYTMPFLNGGAIEPIRLFVRKAGDEEGGGGKRGGGKGDDHRFVIDLNLSRMGRLQLDGLVRREDKLFDLIIRTAHPLPADMRRDILGIFADAGELVGTKGTVAFQAGGQWVEFPPAPPAPTRIEV
ncbi:MAG: DNA polymerase III [Magnetospirillum sp.]|nr:DNA polymerase III [Magnetospirillum sp.]